MSSLHVSPEHLQAPGAPDAGPSRSMIIARIAQGAEPEVARIFGESDSTDLPHAIGVTRRSLYSLGDCYVHLVEFDRSAAQAMADGARLPGFREISKQLEPYIRPYLSTWRSPADATARQFYSWTPGS